MKKMMMKLAAIAVMAVIGTTTAQAQAVVTDPAQQTALQKEKEKAQKEALKARQKAEKEQAKAQKEAKENFEQLAEDLANLEVPVLVDRADYEETENAKAEWIKIFGILFNCEKEANALFETMTK